MPSTKYQVLSTKYQVLSNSAYDRWARILLGADWYHNAFTCSSELGWLLSGFDRVILAVAMRRATLYLSNASGWHRRIFECAASMDCGWASLSLQLLHSRGVLDYPTWVGSGATLEEYRAYVKSVLGAGYAERWYLGVVKHSAEPSYSLLGSGPGSSLSILKSFDFPADVEILMRHWCRLRCGLILLVHLGGLERQAKFQECVFCGQVTRKPLIHCLSLCPRWSTFREQLSAATGLTAGDSHVQFAIRCLSAGSDRAALEIAIRWAADIDDASYRFWRGCESA